MASKNEAQHIVECNLCQQPVSFFCRRCGVNLCDPCALKHLRVKSRNGHDIVDFVSKDDDDDDTCHCDSHPQNDCCAYCKTCDAPICMLCVLNNHKSHEMSVLSDTIDELLKVIARENDRLQSYKQELERLLEHTSKLLVSISSFYRQKKNEVTARGEEWTKLVETTVKKLHQELDDMQKDHEDVLLKQKKEFEGMIEKVDEINRKALKYHKSNNVTEMQTFIPVIEKQETPSEFTQYLFPTFYECKIDAYYLKSYFGYVEKFQEKKTSLIGNKCTENDFSVKTILEVPTVLSVIDTVFPAAATDEYRLYDMAVTDDNKVWMGGESSQLKLFDIQGHLHHVVSITDTGMYFSMYNKRVVFIDHNDNTVKMVSDGDTVDTMFSTGDWEPCGVTSTASDDLLVCLCKDNKSKVVRYSSTGTVLQEIQYDSQCQPLYKDATYITENINGDIIVTDIEENAIIAVDIFGIFRYSYTGKDNDFAVCSVATDFFGDVIVTDFGGDKIHMLDRDGRFLRYVMFEEGIQNPRGVCILANGEMMVGECKTGIAKRIKYKE